MTKNRILVQSEMLFFERGFRGVTLREICKELAIKPASLYYHFPGGKEQIYVEVIRARMAAFRTTIGLIETNATDLRSALIDFGTWYIQQPKMNMVIIAELDLPELTPKSRKLVMAMVGESVFAPLTQILFKFQTSLRPGLDLRLLVSSLTTLLFTVHTSTKMGQNKPMELVSYNVDLFLRGALQ